MSDYSKMTKHPVTGKWEKARWIDNAFGHHNYGVKFEGEKFYHNPATEKLETKDWGKDDEFMDKFTEITGAKFVDVTPKEILINSNEKDLQVTETPEHLLTVLRAYLEDDTRFNQALDYLDSWLKYRSEFVNELKSR
jgi:hypothetical protein